MSQSESSSVFEDCETYENGETEVHPMANLAIYPLNKKEDKIANNPRIIEKVKKLKETMIENTKKRLLENMA